MAPPLKPLTTLVEWLIDNKMGSQHAHLLGGGGLLTNHEKCVGGDYVCNYVRKTARAVRYLLLVTWFITL